MRQICAGMIKGKGPCLGDSGGPLVIRNYLVGIISYGYGCGSGKDPGVYTNVLAYKKWITHYLL